MRACLLLVAWVFVPLLSLAATDVYVQWATSKWGVSVVGSRYAKSTTWGETADPDHDGLPNLLGYACDIDPTRPNLASDCYQFIVPAEGVLSSRFPQIYTLLRTDDPDMRITCKPRSISRPQSTPCAESASQGNSRGMLKPKAKPTRRAGSHPSQRS